MRVTMAFLAALAIHAGLLLLVLPGRRMTMPRLPAADRVAVTLSAAPVARVEAAAQREIVPVERPVPAQEKKGTDSPERQAKAPRPPSDRRPAPERAVPGHGPPGPVRPRLVKRRLGRPPDPPARAAAATGRPDRQPGPVPVAAEDAAPSSPAPAGIRQARPLYRYNPPPGYPALARHRGWQGVVRIRVRVRSDGSVAAATVSSSSGYDLLDRAALAAIRRWHFEPGTRDGRPVESEVLVPIHFELQ